MSPTATSAAAADADALAEVELLQQNLAKVQNLTNRMTGILNQFDSRLVRLESSILPIHKSTQGLTRLQSNIDATLKAMDTVRQHQDVSTEDERIVMAGPDRSDLRPYIKTLQRLAQQLAYLQKSDLRSSRDAVRDMTHMLEVGVRNLLVIFEEWVRDESIPVDAEDYSTTGMAFPPIPPTPMNRLSALLTALQPLIAPLPSKSYTPPSQLYTSHRASYVSASLASLARAAESSLGSPSAAGPLGAMPYTRGSHRAGELIDAAREMASVEWELAEALFPSSPSSSAGPIPQDVFSAIVSAPLASAIQNLQHALLALVRQNTLRHVFVALDVYDAARARARDWGESVGKRRAGAVDGARENEVAALGEKLRGVGLRSFPEVIEEIKARGARPDMKTAGVSELTYDTVNYLRELPQYASTVEPLLETLGDGNWHMGQKVLPHTGGREAGLDGQVIFERYLRDVLSALLSTLLAALNRPTPQSTISLLSSLSYLRRQLIESPTAPSSVSLTPHPTDPPPQDISDLLGAPAEDDLNRALRSARQAYLDAVWRPALMALTAPQAPVKEKFARLNDEVDALERTHRVGGGGGVVSRDVDDQLRDRLAKEAKAMLLPAYATLWGKNRGGEFSKNPQKYMRYTPEELEAKIDSFFLPQQR